MILMAGTLRHCDGAEASSTNMALINRVSRTKGGAYERQWVSGPSVGFAEGRAPSDVMNARTEQCYVVVLHGRNYCKKSRPRPRPFVLACGA